MTFAKSVIGILLCCLNRFFLEDFMTELTWGQKSKKELRRIYRSITLFDWIFFISLRKKKHPNCLCSIVVFLLNIANLVVFLYCITAIFIVPQCGSIFDQAILYSPIGLLVVILIASPFLVPGQYAYRNLQQHQAGSILLALGLPAYFLIYVI